MQTIINDSNCPSCGAIINKKFCAECGEKKRSGHDDSVAHLLEEGLEVFTHIDNSKLFRSFKLLITKPGALTAGYFEGKRVFFMKPLQLFIVCNLLFFFMLGKSNLYALPFYNYQTFQPFTLFGTNEAIAKMANTPAKLEAITNAFNERMITQSKAFIILFIPLIALTCALLFFNRRKFLAGHFVFATHFFTFLLLFHIVFRFVIQLPVGYLLKLDYNPAFDLLGGLAIIAVLIIYLTKAAKQFYSVSTWRAIFSSVFIGFIYFVGILAYRMFLFYKILYSIH